MADLSVIIPGRNEIFMRQTVENVLENIRGDTEIIAVLDGYWPYPELEDHPRLKVIHHTVPVGQRAATNDGAMLSRARYVMKLDAHCAVDEGFDLKLMQDMQPDWTLVPLMYNLHAFDWQCVSCGHRIYQGPKPESCERCGRGDGHEMVVVWKPRKSRLTYSWRFDSNMQFQYWHEHRNRPETRRGQFIETMCHIGACWFMERDRYWELEGLDERHGSWGQVGVETSCKAWLSGGKLLTAKRTWFSHMFRTNNNGFTFPYQISKNAIDRAKEYSRDLWLKDRWPKAVRPLSWLVDKFAPVPGWHDKQG